VYVWKSKYLHCINEGISENKSLQVASVRFDQSETLSTYLKTTILKFVRSMNRIKDVLKIQGRTQIWLARQISRSYVVTTNYCNNKTQPNVAVLVRMADALDVDVRDLLSPTKS
jgi:putative transcriptional regulator